MFCLESDFVVLIDVLFYNEKLDVCFKKLGIMLGVVLVSVGYLEYYEKGNKLIGLNDVVEDVVIYYVGIK